MNEKIKWFSKYIGAEVMITDDDGVRFRNEIANINWRDYYIEITEGWIYDGSEDSEAIKLILKELKDITEEDLDVYYKMENVDIHEYGVGNAIETLAHQEQLFKVEQIDFLRSKGYAIGIPKEYHITK